jgi:hypothetical protein
MEVAALPIPFYPDPTALAAGRRANAGQTDRQLSSAIRNGTPEEQVLQGELLKKNRANTAFKNTDDSNTGERNQQQGEPIPRPRAALTGTPSQQNAINTYLDNAEPVNSVLADRRHRVDIYV